MIRRHLIDPLVTGHAPRRLALVVSAIPLGTFWFAFLVTGRATGLGLAITLLGLPILFGVVASARVFAEAERRLLRGLTGVRTARPDGPLWRGSLLRTLRALAVEPMAWREQGYLMLRFVLGLPLAVVVLAVLGAGLQLLLAPAYAYASPIDLGFWSIDTLPEALVAALAGAVVLALSVPLTDAAGALWVAVARGVLGSPSEADAPAATARSARPPAAPGAARRALAWHAGAYALLNAAMVMIWATTTPGGYFWPFWTIVPLGTILAIHAAVVLAPVALPDAGRRRLGLVRHAAVAAIVGAFMVLVWVFTTPGGYFWPVWVLVGLAVPVGVRALAMAMRSGEREAMAERIDVLTTTRAGAVDAQAAELRRIERDLHDGAQARLVALAMDLGMARERLADAPEDARTLVAGAHEEAKRALVELRGLARGIHPAVLTDRGLEAALGSLAATSRIPVRLQVDVEGRLDPALEAAAYFAVAEGLANAAKHSGAGVIEVAVARAGGALRVRVADDGAGGADPLGEGLLGLRRRIEAHDGVLSVVSPPGGGTILEAVVPCGS